MSRPRERALVVRSALDRATRKPYHLSKHNCWTVVNRVVRAVNRDVKMPKFPTDKYGRIRKIVRKTGGIYQWGIDSIKDDSLLEYGPLAVKPGDIWLCESEGHELGGFIGVFDPGIHPVHWTDESQFEVLQEFPCHIWTYPDGW